MALKIIPPEHVKFGQSIPGCIKRELSQYTVITSSEPDGSIKVDLTGTDGNGQVILENQKIRLVRQALRQIFHDGNINPDDIKIDLVL